MIENGQKPKVLFVYCDPKTAWGRVASRTKKGGHAVSENDFAGVHAQAIRNFDALRKEFGNDIIATVIDNRGDVGKMKFIKADEFSKLPRYTKKEILDVITGRGSEGPGVSGGAQEPSGKRGQVKPTATVRVPDGKGRIVTKPVEPVRPAPAAQSEGVTAEALRERAKTDPELRRLDEAQKKAKTDAERNALLAKAQERIEELRKEMEEEAKVEKPKAVESGEAKTKTGNSIVDADTARTDENWGFRKATNAIEYQEQMDALEKYQNSIIAKYPKEPINPKTKKPYGNNTPQYKEYLAKVVIRLIL